MHRDAALNIAAALQLLPNAVLQFDHKEGVWRIDYGSKDNRHSCWVGRTLEELGDTLSHHEWGGWSAS